MSPPSNDPYQARVDPAAQERIRDLGRFFSANLDRILSTIEVERGITYSQMAIDMGLTPRHLKNWREDVHEAGVGRAAYVAERLGVSLDDLLRDPSQPPAAAPGAGVEEEVSRGTGAEPRERSPKRSGQAKKR